MCLPLPVAALSAYICTCVPPLVSSPLQACVDAHNPRDGPRINRLGTLTQHVRYRDLNQQFLETIQHGILTVYSQSLSI